MMLGSPVRSQPADYEASWCSLQKRDRLVWVIAVSFVPCMAALMIGVMMADKQVTPQLFVYAAILWLFVYVGASHHRLDFRCPRCAQRFFTRGRSATSCASCGLPLWTAGRSRDAAEPAATKATLS
jgi:ribosomal protein L37E